MKYPDVRVYPGQVTPRPMAPELSLGVHNMIQHTRDHYAVADELERIARHLRAQPRVLPRVLGDAAQFVRQHGDVPAIYYIHETNGECVYIGITSDIQSAMKANTKTLLPWLTMEHYAVIKTTYDTHKERVLHKKLEIDKIQPRYNPRKVKNFS